MKAIDILKEYANIDFGCDESDLHDRINEAIAELEELQNRSCEGCVNHLSANGNFPLTCLDCSRFCVDKYKKENK